MPSAATYTVQNANKAIQYDADLAWFKSGWYGTHNFKFGYQLNRLQNNILQHYNEPYVQIFPGAAGAYSPTSAFGVAQCNAIQAANGFVDGTVTRFAPVCTERSLSMTSVPAETSPASTTACLPRMPGRSAMASPSTLVFGSTRNTCQPAAMPGLATNPINFSWGDKVAPRIGAAWDVFKDGKMKVFGSYGKFFDIMKLNVAISSFGGQYWNTCTYALDTSNIASINPALDAAGRYCVGSTSTGAIWPGGTQPAGLTFIENNNFRTFPTTCSTCELTSTGVVPGLKPYKQHETVFGVDYQLAKNLAFEARWDRRRLDHVIEDSSIIATTGPAAGSETFVIGNPGQGTEGSFNSFYNFLYPQPANPPPPACSGVDLPDSAHDSGSPQLRRCGIPPDQDAQRSLVRDVLLHLQQTARQLHRLDQFGYFRRPGGWTQLTEQQPCVRRAVLPVEFASVVPPADCCRRIVRTRSRAMPTTNWAG